MISFLSLTLFKMLTIGNQIPTLVGKDQHGNDVALQSFKGKKMALYFYPKDDTPGCTAQACSIRDGEMQLKSEGIVVIGVSADSGASHLKFTHKYHLPFPLITDMDRSIIEAFGVWGPKKFMGRVYDGIHRKTFLFNEDGILINIIEKPDTKNHAEEIIQLFSKK